MLIKSLFDPSKDIYRTIEKVITYNASQEARLKAEIAEYQVTDSIEEQFEKLLGKMQVAMDQGGQNEIGVWVSGFYGSGKSSFTKYLGLALDQDVQVDGVRFLEAPPGSPEQAADQGVAEHRGQPFPGRGGDAGPGQRDARRRHDGRGLDGPLLQGPAMGRLLAQSEGCGVGAALAQRWPL